ncbi:GNAT domain-containing protein [Bisporella sp. PMI_857]|nr:GNAT domain-containing protein [Bisporella sp. PMI_857]
MTSSPPPPEFPFSPFVILTPNLVLVPTPTAISLSTYRDLYSSLHGNPSFCEMAFAHHFPARSWSDEEVHEVIRTRDVVRCWGRRGMGDFAVGLLPPHFHNNFERLQDWAGFDIGKVIKEGLRIVDGFGYDKLFGADGKGLEGMEWVGYAGVRDATTTSLPEREAGDYILPEWKEMVELRYGFGQEYWGKGIARAAAEAVMLWAVEERDVRRFIAETERGNVASGKVLEKLGFVIRGEMPGKGYWKEESQMEWEKVVA